VAASASKKWGGHAISSSLGLGALTPNTAAVSAVLISAALRFRVEETMVGEAARPLRFRPLDEDLVSWRDVSMGG